MADDSICSSMDSIPPHPSGHSSARLFLALSLLPAFVLCLAHGILSHHLVPAIGLVPLAVSTAGSIFLLRRSPEDAGPNTRRFAHPIVVFAYDVVLAAALMVVLVFTWIAKGGTPELSMLAAYATIPLLFNFLVHLYLALGSIYAGLAIGGLVHWLIWRTLPPECPNCNHRLSPDLPELPWLSSFRRSRSEYAALFVDEEDRYHDEEDVHPENVHPEQSETTPTPQPEAVEVKKKDKRVKGNSSSSTPPEEPTSPWNP
ncbi:Fc.00g019580.m01.CDS01 [Cosmosporella sp. VM-42]